MDNAPLPRCRDIKLIENLQGIRRVYCYRERGHDNPHRFREAGCDWRDGSEWSLVVEWAVKKPLP